MTNRGFFFLLTLVQTVIAPFWSNNLVQAQSWDLKYHKESRGGSHYLYQEIKDGLPVFNSRKRLHKFKSHLLSDRETRVIHVPRTCPEKELKDDFLVIESTKGYWRVGTVYIPVVKELHRTVKGKYVEKIMRDDQLWSCALGFAFLDTTIDVNVFEPNPIVSAAVQYGGEYVDNSDQSNSSLDAELVQKTMDVQFESGKLKSKYFTIEEFNEPIVLFPDTGSFLFNRSDSAFEAFNTYYHLYNLYEYIDQTLGFSAAVDSSLQIDVHGLSGADNSLYQGVGSSPQIIFGDGGVDDAEDGQVIVHEAGHAIIDAIAPNSNEGFERRAIDEGIADYLAASYTRYYSSGNYHDLPTWDGHNEFWDGRTLNNSKSYPDDLGGDYHLNGEIWSSTVMTIEDSLGRDTAMSLQLESAFLYHQDMSMVQAASYILSADSALYEGVHYSLLREVFCDKGLGQDCDSAAFFEGTVTVDRDQMLQRRLSFSKNYRQFTYFDVLNIKGQVVFTGQMQQNIDLSFLPAAVYMIRLYGGSEEQMLKVVFP